MAIEYKVIGSHIHAARKQKKMTQEAVAEALGVSLNHFGKVERGDRPINLQRLSQLSLLLEIPLETLVEGSVIADDGIAVQNANTAEASDFLDSIESLPRAVPMVRCALCCACARIFPTRTKSTSFADLIVPSFSITAFCILRQSFDWRFLYVKKGDKFVRFPYPHFFCTI